jgi:hypothetical protein
MVSLCFLAKVTFKKVAAHKNGKSMNAHRKTHTQKHQYSKTAGFLNSTQANFHSKNLKLFLCAKSRLGLDFSFILANTSSVSGAKVRNQRLYIYTHTGTKNQQITNDKLKNHPTLEISNLGEC